MTGNDLLVPPFH
jgi:hypothetical protein